MNFVSALLAVHAASVTACHPGAVQDASGRCVMKLDQRPCPTTTSTTTTTPTGATNVVGCISGAQREQGYSGDSHYPTWKMHNNVHWAQFTFREAMCRCQRGPVGHLKWHGAQHLDVIDEDPSKPNYMFMGLGGATANGVNIACFNGHMGPQGAEGRKHHEELVQKCWDDRGNYHSDQGNSCSRDVLTPGSDGWKFPDLRVRVAPWQFNGYIISDDGLPLEQCQNGGVEKTPSGAWQYSDNPNYPRANYNAAEVRGLLRKDNGDIDIGAMRTDMDGAKFYAGGWERYAVYRVPAPSAYDCQGYCDTYQSHEPSGRGVRAKHDTVLKGVEYKAGEYLPYRLFGKRQAHCTPGGVQDGAFPTGTATDFSSSTPL